MIVTTRVVWEASRRLVVLDNNNWKCCLLYVATNVLSQRFALLSFILIFKKTCVACNYWHVIDKLLEDCLWSFLAKENLSKYQEWRKSFQQYQQYLLVVNATLSQSQICFSMSKKSFLNSSHAIVSCCWVVLFFFIFDSSTTSTSRRRRMFLTSSHKGRGR